MRPYKVAVALVLVTACCTAARAEEPEVGAARQVFEKHQNTVVWVTAVMKMRPMISEPTPFDVAVDRANAL